LTLDSRAPGRSAAWLIIAMAAIAGLIFLTLAAPSRIAAGDNAKWFICKYVGTPGVDETLQTGQNPISVSENAIPISPVVAGEFFQDSQGRSFVLVEDTGQPEPDPSECPPPDGGEGTPTPEGSQAGGTGTPAASVPSAAMDPLPGGGPVATLIFATILLGSLGALAYANVAAVRRRS
jgi:hypothetical protein